ncbi:MAG: hypothetical protein ABIY50_10735 [Ignavibacteria bacterium]
MKKIIIIFLLTVNSVSFGNLVSYSTKNEFKSDKKIFTSTQTHTYVRVLINGKWWIYEYDEDGKLINVYPDEE